MSCTIPTEHSAHTQARAHTHSSRIHHTIHSGLLHTQFYSIYPAIQIYVILGRCANKSHIMFDSLVSMLFVHCTVYRVLCTVSHTQKFRTLCVCCIWNWNEWAFVTLADTHTHRPSSKVTHKMDSKTIWEMNEIHYEQWNPVAFIYTHLWMNCEHVLSRRFSLSSSSSVSAASAVVNAI